jgi:hypothetical protein
VLLLLLLLLLLDEIVSLRLGALAVGASGAVCHGYISQGRSLT